MEVDVEVVVEVGVVSVRMVEYALDVEEVAF